MSNATKLTLSACALVMTMHLLHHITNTPVSYAKNDNANSTSNTPKKNESPPKIEVVNIGIACAQYENCSLPESEAVVKEAYSRIGVNVLFQYMPTARDIAEADAGSTDGTSFRSRSALSGYKNLIYVNVPLFKLTYSAYYLRSDITIDSLDDLKKLHIGALRGSFTILNRLHAMSCMPSELNDMTQGIRMLQAGRLDAVILEGALGEEAVQRSGIKDIRTRHEIYSDMLYHVVNKRLSPIVPSLEAAFAEMKRDGSLKRLAGKYAALVSD